MKFFLAITVSLIISQASFGATLQVNNVWQPGGAGSNGTLTVPENNPNGYFTVFCGGGTNSSGYYSSCYKNGSVYQVTSGKSFKIREICAYSNGAGNSFQLVTDTVSIGGFNFSAPGGTIVWQGGASGNYVLQSGPTGNGNFQCYNYTWEMAANTYAGYQAGGANFYAITLIGKEE